MSPDSTFLAAHLPPVIRASSSDASTSSAPLSRAVSCQVPEAGTASMVCPVHGAVSYRANTYLCANCREHDGHAMRHAPLNAEAGPSTMESIVNSLDDFSIDDSEMTLDDTDSLPADAVQQLPPAVAVQQPPPAVPIQQLPPAVAVQQPPPAVAPQPAVGPAYTPFFAPASNAPSWYVVTCGKTVGVFDDSAVMVHSVSRISGGAGRGGFATRDAAIAAFQNTEAAGVVKQTLYHTAKERRLAKLEQARCYRASSKGKATKANANHRQYEHRKQAEDARLSVGIRLPDIALSIPGVLLEGGARVLRPSWSVYLSPTQPSTPPWMGPWMPPYRYMPVPTRDLAALPASDNLWNSVAACLGTYQNTEIIEAAGERYD
ncbi:hypothetical protein C8T65DRAFT_744794 [Cerioporus squamosus]|nr:hypothetical protein C8T65DRAFT_744794 [Cerioporus squamosus]